MLPTSEQIRACETATACAVASGFDSCIRTVSDIAGSVARTGSATFGPAEVTCLARAGADCDAALRCTNQGAAPESCSDGPAQCAGDIIHACVFGFTHAFDCSSVGLRCIAGSTGSASCGADSCGSNSGRCDVSGAAILDCTDGVLRRRDCALDGAACVFSGPVATCGGTGRACNITAVCDGDVIVSCDSGHELRRDCSARGLHCVVIYDPNGTFDCGNGTDCDPATPASCDGAGRVHYCYLGTPLVADCKAAGFSGCTNVGCVR